MFILILSYCTVVENARQKSESNSFCWLELKITFQLVNSGWMVGVLSMTSNSLEYDLDDMCIRVF